MQFRWIDWNQDPIAKLGIEPKEAEFLIRHAQSPFPQQIGEDRLLVQGQGRGGRFLQVVYVLDPDNTIFVIHARPLTDREKRRYRRRRR